MHQKGSTTLYLIPTRLSENSFDRVLPPYVIDVIHGLCRFIVEDLRSARRFISQIRHPAGIDRLMFRELNEHTSRHEIDSMLQFMQTSDAGIISEAGVPAVADPGAAVVRLAHKNSIKVVPLVGPSSILLALMASGLNGQSFTFEGYLPVKKNERQNRLRLLERRSQKELQTQIFIETPYRNMQLLEDILTCCHSSTMLTIAADITGNNEYILTQTVQQWKTKLPELHKIPAVFLLQAHCNS